MPTTATPAPPDGVTVRRAGWDDLDAVVDLLAAASRARVGAVTVRREDLRLRWLGLESLDTVVLLEDFSSPQPLVAYAAVDLLDDPDTATVELHVDGHVHPATPAGVPPPTCSTGRRPMPTLRRRRSAGTR